MIPADRSAWIAWAEQKAECFSTGRPFPGASKPITEDEAAALRKAWRERRGMCESA